MNINRVYKSLCAILFIVLVFQAADTDRNAYLSFLGFFTASSAFAIVMYRRKYDWTWWLAAGIIARLSLFWTFPGLSDDVYRFFWDGMLTISGIDQFAHTPTQLMETPGLLPDALINIFPNLNSPDYHSVYPTVCQWIFSLSAKLSGGEIGTFILWLRSIIVVVEMASLYLLYLLTNDDNRMPLVIYAVNPLVICELTGNLHLEAVVIPLLLCTWLLLKRRLIPWAGPVLAAAIATKLNPVIIVPYLIRRLPPKKLAFFFMTLFGALILLFIPLLKTLTITGITSSLDLYFRVFEFNASVYYVMRELGQFILGYNAIASIGPLLGAICVIILLVIALKEKGPTLETLPGAFVIAFSIYLFCSTTVHPWYITPLIAFCGFSSYRFPIVWSFVVVLSYAAYQTHPVLENYWLISLEYAIVGAMLMMDILKKRSDLILQ